MTDIKAEITKLEIGPTDFVVIKSDRPLSIAGLEQMYKLAQWSGLPAGRVILVQPGITISVATAKEASALLAAPSTERIPAR